MFSGIAIDLYFLVAAIAFWSVAAHVIQLVRDVGRQLRRVARDRVQVDLFHLTLQEDDRILLCTDGLTDMVDDSTILELVTLDESSKNASERLVKMALHNGGRDNVTVVLSRVNE